MGIENPADLFEDVKIVELTHEEYHSAPYDVATNSRLKTIHDDVHEYFCRHVSKEIPFKETDALLFGRVTHAVILERQNIVHEKNFTSDTLAVFRPCPVPTRECDISNEEGEIWIVSSPEPGLVRRSDIWGDMGCGRHWRLSPDRWDQVPTAYCAFADMHIDGIELRHVPRAALSPAGKRTGKVWDAWEAEHQGEYLMVPDEWQKVLWMRARLRHHKEAYKRLFCGGKSEVSIVGRCVSTGLKVQTRLDFLASFTDVEAITDLKTSRDATPALWNKQAFSDRLHVQSAIQTGLASHVFEKPISYRFAVVDKAAPYRPETFIVPEEVIEIGCEDYLKDIRVLERCIDTGSWYHEGFGEPNKMEVPASRMVKWA